MDSKVRKQFGRKIRTLRKMKGMSQEALAHEANIERSYMGAIERGQRSPTLDKISAIAKALKVPIPEIFSRWFLDSTMERFREITNLYTATIFAPFHFFGCENFRELVSQTRNSIRVAINPLMLFAVSSHVLPPSYSKRSELRFFFESQPRTLIQSECKDSVSLQQTIELAIEYHTQDLLVKFLGSGKCSSHCILQSLKTDLCQVDHLRLF